MNMPVPLGKKLYILEWVLFPAALVPLILAEAFPADARGPWYMTALALVAASLALQVVRWWGPERYHYRPEPPPSSEQPAGRVVIDRSRDRPANVSQRSVRYNFSPASLSSGHSGRLIMTTIAAFFVLLYVLIRSVVGNQGWGAVWLQLIVTIGAIIIKIFFGWPDDKQVSYKPAYKPGWHSIRSSGNLRKHKHKR